MTLNSVQAERDSLLIQDPDDLLPPRTRLMPLQPLGMGSAQRESLSSYFQRLADQHCLSPRKLARDLAIPSLGLKKVRKVQQHDRNWRTSFFSGLGDVPTRWTRVLEGLTGVKALRRLTLLPLQGLIGMPGTASHTRRWCPLCIHEDEQFSTPYGQLLWDIGLVQACPFHEIRLVSTCGCDPADRLHPLRVKHLPHLCDACGSSLARGEDETFEMASAEEVNIAKKVAALLGSDFFEGEDAGSQGKGFRGLLRAAMHPDLAGSGAGLARVIGVSTATMSGWLSGKHLPSLGQAIATAEALNLTLEEALTGRGSVRLIVRGALAKKEKDKEREAQKPKVAWLSKKELRAAMERLSLVEPPMSLVAMARAIGTSARELRRREKDLSREIARRSKEWKEKRAVERWKARQARISALAAKVAEEGLRATRRRLEERMGDSLVFLLNSEFPKEVFDDAETALT